MKPNYILFQVVLLLVSFLGNGNSFAQEMKPIVLRDGRELVKITKESYLYEKPSLSSPVITDQYANLEMVTEESQVLVSRENDDWYKYEFERWPKNYTAYFPAANATPVMTKGIPLEKRLYIKSWTDEPDDDYTGCWQPSEDALFIYPNNLGIIMKKGFEQSMTIGLMDGGAFKPVWFCWVNYEDNSDHPDQLRFTIPAPEAENQTVKIIVGRECLLHNKGVEEDKLGMPDIFIYPPTEIVRFFIPNRKPSKCLISPGCQPNLITAEYLEELGFRSYDMK